MGSRPSVSGKELCKVLEKDGYVFVRQRAVIASIKKRTEDGVITIPVHSNKSLKQGTLMGIMRKAGITKERLKFLLSLLLG